MHTIYLLEPSGRCSLPARISITLLLTFTSLSPENFCFQAKVLILKIKYFAGSVFPQTFFVKAEERSLPKQPKMFVYLLTASLQIRWAEDPLKGCDT